MLLAVGNGHTNGAKVLTYMYNKVSTIQCLLSTNATKLQVLNIEFSPYVCTLRWVQFCIQFYLFKWIIACQIIFANAILAWPLLFFTVYACFKYMYHYITIWQSKYSEDIFVILIIYHVLNNIHTLVKSSNAWVGWSLINSNTSVDINIGGEFNNDYRI